MLKLMLHDDTRNGGPRLIQPISLREAISRTLKYPEPRWLTAPLALDALEVQNSLQPDGSP